MKLWMDGESWTCGSRLMDSEKHKQTDIKDDGWDRQMDRQASRQTD
jgi:hypothetical protein